MVFAHYFGLSEVIDGNRLPAKCKHLSVIIRRGRLPVSVIIVVGDGHLSRVDVHVDELNPQVLL